MIGLSPWHMEVVEAVKVRVGFGCAVSSVPTNSPRGGLERGHGLAYHFRTMKQLLAWMLFASMALGAEPQTTTGGAAEIEFLTISPGGKYAPKNVLAVWVADAQTNWIATLLKRAGKRQKYLLAWNKARGTNETPDAITGPTRLTHEPVNAAWNLRDSQGNNVPDGHYFFVLEFTDQHAPGPVECYPFFKGATPVSAAYEDRDHVKAVRVTYRPGQPR